MDTDVKDAWISAIFEFEQRLNALKARKKVKAARDLSEVAEGLRIAVCQCRPSLLVNSQLFTSGSYQDSSLLSRTHTTDKNERHDQHASLTNVHPD